MHIVFRQPWPSDKHHCRPVEPAVPYPLTLVETTTSTKESSKWPSLAGWCHSKRFYDLPVEPESSFFVGAELHDREEVESPEVCDPVR